MFAGCTFGDTLETSPFVAISDSIALVASGNAGAPSGVENLMPLYSGGLCDAVKLIAPSVFDRITSYEIAGVGAGFVITNGCTPNELSTSAAMLTKRSPM